MVALSGDGCQEGRMRKPTWAKKTIILAVLIMAFALYQYLTFPIECRGPYSSPDDKYLVVVTRPRWEGLIPRFPGQGGDSSGWVEIFAQGESMGKAWLPMVWWVDDLKWTKSGAKIHGVGEWNFAKGTCWYYRGPGISGKTWSKKPN